MAKWNASRTQDQAATDGPRPGVHGEQARPGGGRQGGAPPGGGLKAAMDSARALMKDKNFAAAKAAFEKILDENPEAAPAYIGMGNAHAATGQYEDALEYYAAARHIRADLPAAMIMSANVYVKLEQHDKALELFEEALSVKPDLTQARLGAARILGKNGRHEEAIEQLETALQYNPQLEEARLAMAGIYQGQGEHGKAVEELEGIVSRNPAFWQAHAQLARLRAGEGNYREAVQSCEQAVGLQADSIKLHYLLGQLLRESGNADRAIEEFSRISDMDPGFQLGKLATVSIYLDQDRLDEAGTLLTEMSEQSKNRFEIHRLLAEIAMRRRDYASAAAQYRAAVLNAQEELLEKYPQLSAVKTIEGDGEKAAKSLQSVFEGIMVINTRLFSETEET